MCKNFYKQNILLVIFMLYLVSSDTFNSKKINKSLLKEKFNETRKFPQPKRNKDMNYVSCCCFTKLGYYGWYQEVPKNKNDFCVNFHSCIEKAFIGECSEFDQSNKF